MKFFRCDGVLDVLSAEEEIVVATAGGCLVETTHDFAWYWVSYRVPWGSPEK
jgi:hypothetical protein